jgi:hypothetical protein
MYETTEGRESPVFKVIDFEHCTDSQRQRARERERERERERAVAAAESQSFFIGMFSISMCLQQYPEC